MLLYMIRHGESVANRENYFGSWLHVSLTEKGIEDARAAGEKLRGVKFDRIYSSDLLRACQTCEYALPGCSYEKTQLLREINVGTLNGKNISWCREEYKEAFQNTVLAYGFDTFGGESRKEHRERMLSFLKILEENPAEKIIAFSHAGTIKRMLEICADTQEHLQVPCDNGSVWIFEFKDGEWKHKEN